MSENLVSLPVYESHWKYLNIALITAIHMFHMDKNHMESIWNHVSTPY